MTKSSPSGLIVLVLGIFLSNTAEAVDPDLLAWYKLDEGTGTTAFDSSGNENHGVIIDATWADGLSGGALNFDGDGNYVDCGNPAMLDFGIGDWSVCVWINTTTGGSESVSFGKGGHNGIRYTLGVGESYDDKMALTTSDNVITQRVHSATSVTDGIWHHAVGVREGNNIKIYIDGKFEGDREIPYGYDLSGTSQHNALIGAITNHLDGSIYKYYEGLIDDVRIYGRALIETEIEEICFCYDVNKACNPNPPDGAVDVLPDSNLTWIPGDNADWHQVYLGIDSNALALVATKPLGDESYNPGQLGFITTYYWQIVEVSDTHPDSPWPGSIWSFRTALEDCNGNLIPDPVDIATGISQDTNGNGIPDECEPDCNGNGVTDDVDIATGTSLDCNGNGIPDECDIALGTSFDCNGNGIPDECDIANSTSLDCNGNGIPDECDIAFGISLDCNGNGIPDECDIASGTSLDINSNGIPDECELAFQSNADIGNPLPGSAGYDSATGTWTITADGNDIWGHSDAFHYVYLPLTGDCEIIAHVVSITPEYPRDWKKAGVMIREMLDDNSKHAMMLITGGSGGGKAFHCRPSTGGSTFSSHDDDQVYLPPYWIKLSRAGNTFTGYYSSDGSNWVQQPNGIGIDATTNPVDINMAPTVYIGLAHTSHSAFSMSTAVIDNVSITKPESPDPNFAHYPNPGDGNTIDGFVYPDPPFNIYTSLRFTPAYHAVSHEAFFSDNLSYVIARNPSVSLGEPDVHLRYSVGTIGTDSLVRDTTYYWCVDETDSNGVVWRGAVWRFYVRSNKAYDPTPSDGENVGIENAIYLSWLPGYGAVSHDVYFGTDQAVVTSADNSSPEFQDNLPLGTELYMVTDLVPFTTYYWRIDELNGFKGNIWSFITGMDCNGNLIPDPVDIATGTSQDINGNGVPDECDPDCNGNGVPDDVDIATGTSQDINRNGIPDECDLDCNGNGVPDDVDIATGTSLDCNGNAIPDECDIAAGTSQDINGNGVPDECDPDCNGNGIPDDIDISSGTSLDCNGNSIPDECDIANGTSLDCNGNGIPDECDIAAGTSQDLNGNGIPDECEPDCNGNGVPDDFDIATGTSQDINGNGIPDECDPDCNGNGVPDDVDIATGTSLDINGNGMPDECDAQFPWANADIGSAQGLPGSASYNHITGVGTVTGSGHDIDGSEDGFHYLFRPLSGDGTMEINLVSMDVTDDLAKAGVLIRETLDPGSRHAFIAIRALEEDYEDALFTWREETGGTSTSTSRSIIWPYLPRKLKITRTGDLLQGHAWEVIVPGMLEAYILIGEISIPMNTDVYIGIAVCSNDTEQLCTAVFDNVTWPAYTHTRAWLPSPDDGSKSLPISGVTLSWMKGDDASIINGHEVYFGNDPYALPLVSTQTATAYDTGPLEYDTVYYWRIDEVAPGGITTGDVWSFKTERYGTGSILREIWEGITGDLVSDLTSHPDYPDNPTWTDELTLMESPAFDPDKEYYGGRMIGYLYPETSGDYTFWIASDDSSELWLSTTESAADANKIAYLIGFCGVPRDWDNETGTNNPYQQSAPVKLEGSRIYYISAIWKEHGGGDHCAVAWQGPDCPERDVIDGYYLSPSLPSLRAFNPYPHDSAVDVPIDANLSWTPGLYTAEHEVYFGSAPDALELVATKPLGDEIYNPGQLAFDTPYYWQIVEVNETHPDSPWTGGIWCFRTLLDCNRNLIPDHIDITDGNSLDCNGNGIPDECDIADGNSLDCNGNDIPDECDIASGTSMDGNEDGIPDECQVDVRVVPVAVLTDPASTSEVRTALPDSISAVARGDTYYIEIWASDTGDENTGVTNVYVDVSFCGEMSAMSLEHGTIFTTFPTGIIQSGGVDEFGGSGLTSGIEPEWVRVGWIEMICNAEVPECTISLLESTTGIAALERGPIPWWAIHLGSITLYRDCNGNGIPDTNDIAAGTSQDINGNGVPDECDPDCNGNGVPDDIDIANGTSNDTNQDGIPDECDIDVRVVPVAVLIDPASTSEVRTTLPDSMPAVVRGGTYYIEIWASDLGATNTGLTNVYVDLSFSSQTSATALEHGTIFTTFPSGTIQAGGVDEFGGSALPSGIEPEWVRVGWVQMSADVDIQTCTISLLPSSTGVAALERGSIPWVFVDLGLVELQITPPARSYDLNGDNSIGVADWSYWIGSWLQPVPPADTEDDFDCDCFVGVGDLSWFATGWMKFTDDPTILYPPCPDPNCGGEMSAGAANAGITSTETGTLDTSMDVALEVVVLDAQSGSDTTTTLPVSVNQLASGQTYYVEVWVSDVGDIDTGITSAYVDLSFPGDALSIVNISHGGIFTAVPDGSAGSSVIDELGGSTLTEGVGVEPQWARVAVVRMHADATPPFVAFTLSPSSTGIGAYGRGQIPWEDVSLGSFIISPPADLNKNGRVDFFDFAILADQWRGTPGDPSADIAPEAGDGEIDFFDLALMVEYWLEGINP